MTSEIPQKPIRLGQRQRRRSAQTRWLAQEKQEHADASREGVGDKTDAVLVKTTSTMTGAKRPRRKRSGQGTHESDKCTELKAHRMETRSRAAAKHRSRLRSGHISASNAARDAKTVARQGDSTRPPRQRKGKAVSKGYLRHFKGALAPYHTRTLSSGWDAQLQKDTGAARPASRLETRISEVLRAVRGNHIITSGLGMGGLPMERC
ncbi:hypothetical protein IE81DRAFT_8015 [Ceraceosorus guamensis]|uniref:Uncharacterized protein n=1 Tax=Ceraceosorus guamensis TaxID=1522189 RepID=A0A316WAA0_9BASI|nr:hypothetical protein IE81DRAFT_8015 [Ceraceosorus guamensis]PWN46424.1 hypothetical protein IE81DRAFT_8015 [Ceraceosorus guamensis]